MIVYSPAISPRLQYTIDFMAKEMQEAEFRLTDSKEEFLNYTGAKINYSHQRITNEIWIVPFGKNGGIVFETQITQQETRCFNYNGMKAFFKTGGDYPFDVIAASFYLLSRYEEYLPHEKDEYGRFAHKNSLAYKENFLHQPLVNMWMKDFKIVIRERWPNLPLKPITDRFSFLPTYDIDIAWSYKHKGFIRNTGGLLAEVFKGRFKSASTRLRVLWNSQEDPFDVYDWLHALHGQYNLKPYYFFLIANKTGKFDKNIPPHNPAMKELIKQHALHYPVGIHPSWQSGDENSLLKKEITDLSSITAQQILCSRQHYIRFQLPDTFRALLERGILFDFSMGYGSINGFRASVASPYYWYDLQKDHQTELMLFPFCYMDANSLFEQRLSPAKAYEEMEHYYKAVKDVAGTLVIIWHNFILSGTNSYAGWREIYQQFLAKYYEKELALKNEEKNILKV